MEKKLITACIALFALTAFILPAGASASPVVTHPTGTKLVTGVKFTATNVGAMVFTSTAGAVLMECTKASMTGTLTKNNGTEVEGTIETASITGTEASTACTKLGGAKDTTNVGNGTPWCLSAKNTYATDEFQIRGGGCSEAARSITFVLDSGTAGVCKYSRSTPVKGTFTTDTTGDAILTTTGAGETGVTDTLFTREEGGVLCPSDTTLDLSLTLETDVATATPLFIS